MKKYRVFGKFTGYVSTEVEAENAGEAVEKAYEEFNGIRSYAGNGGWDKLIGVSGAKETIDFESEIEWEQPEEEPNHD